MATATDHPKKNRDGTMRPGPYQHLAEEFDRRVKALVEAGEIVDPRLAQIERLKEANAVLKSRLDRQGTEIADLTASKQLAVSRIAAQHLEIERLRAEAAAGRKVSVLTQRKPITGTIGSCN